MERSEIRIAFLYGERAERKSDGDVIDRVGIGRGRDGGGWNGEFD
jgi:hypothetical protein